MVDTIDIRVGMMVSRKPRDAFHIAASDRQPLKKRLYQRRALELLIFAVGIAVLFPAQRTGNIMHHGGKLQNFLRVPVQPLQLSNRFRHRPDLEKMVDITNISPVKFDHPLCRSRNDHKSPPLKRGALLRHEKSGHIGMLQLQQL